MMPFGEHADLPWNGTKVEPKTCIECTGPLVAEIIAIIENQTPGALDKLNALLESSPFHLVCKNCGLPGHKATEAECRQINETWLQVFINTLKATGLIGVVTI